MQQQQINLTKNVTLEFTPQQLSTVIFHLNKGIFEQVASVISSIEKQVIEQVQVKVDEQQNVSSEKGDKN